MVEWPRPSPPLPLFTEVRGIGILRNSHHASEAGNMIVVERARTRLGSGSGRRIPRVLDKKVSAHHVLRAGLRALVVALDPVCYRPPPPAHSRLRAFSRSDSRASDHPRQDWGGGITAKDGALASRAEMVRGGPLAPCGDQPCRSSVQCPVGCPGSLLGRTR